ncbi:hypothetical protein Cni_G02619 [Canna indica]|uniref:Uncharacterized protein n=1 Tax=Canna indica TaxID=4628 RepID=A0AAQ3JPP7_9LILI|nr:hypothetical protein Cni_G02619 [Canna indica]
MAVDGLRSHVIYLAIAVLTIASFLIQRSVAAEKPAPSPQPHGRRLRPLSFSGRCHPRLIRHRSPPRIAPMLNKALILIFREKKQSSQLNDVFEFIGIYTFDRELAVHKDDSDDPMYDLFEDPMAHLPPSKRGRLSQAEIIMKKLYGKEKVVEVMHGLGAGWSRFNWNLMLVGRFQLVNGQISGSYVGRFHDYNKLATFVLEDNT